MACMSIKGVSEGEISKYSRMQSQEESLSTFTKWAGKRSEAR